MIAALALLGAAWPVTGRVGAFDRRGRVALGLTLGLTEIALLAWFVAPAFGPGRGPLTVAALAVVAVELWAVRRSRSTARSASVAAAAPPPSPKAPIPAGTHGAQVLGGAALMGGAATLAFGLATLVGAAVDRTRDGALADRLGMVQAMIAADRIAIGRGGARGTVDGFLLAVSALGGRAGAATGLVAVAVAAAIGAWWLLRRIAGLGDALGAGIGSFVAGAVAIGLAGSGVGPSAGLAVAGALMVLVAARHRADTRRPWSARRRRRRGEPFRVPDLGEDVEWASYRHRRRRPDRTAARWILVSVVLAVGLATPTAGPAALLLAAAGWWGGVRRAEPGRPVAQMGATEAEARAVQPDRGGPIVGSMAPVRSSPGLEAP